MSDFNKPTSWSSRCRHGLVALGLISLLLAGSGSAWSAADARVDATRVALREAARDSAERVRPPLLSRELFLDESTVSAVQLSPDGRHVVFRRTNASRSELLLRNLDNDRESRVVANAEGIETHWSSDGRRLWLADKLGLAVYEVDSGAARRILKWDATRGQRFWTVPVNAAAFALIREKLAVDGHWRYRYLRVDANGRSVPVHEAAWPLRDAMLDANGDLAFSVAYDGARYDSVIRRHGDDGARELLRCVGVENCRLVDARSDGGALLVLTHHGADLLTLQRWQARNQAWETLHRDPDGIADASQLLRQPGSGDWLAIAYHPDRRRWYGRDARTQAQLDALQRRLSEANFDLMSTTDGRRWLVRAWHATWQHDQHFVYTPESDRLVPLFAAATNSMSGVAPDLLAAAVPLSYRARDGMLLHGYVFLPPGISAEKAPLIALIHGGPYNRDRDNFDPLVQLLVNRGYAVFKPNFRASTGYGLRYTRAAGGDFGDGRVLGDIIDGLDFLLDEGIGDRDRQAVMGHSFGAYASLLAVSHHPERFRFAVASAAPVDFSWVMHWIANHDSSALPDDGPPAEVMFPHYGVPFADPTWRDAMRREAPLGQVQRLRTPVHLWAGARDDRVPIKSISRYAADAKRHGAKVSLLIDPDAGHNPNTRLSLEAVLYLYEQAAARHFGGALTPASAQLQAFLEANLRLDAAADGSSYALRAGSSRAP